MMKAKLCYILWAVLYALCTWMGFRDNPEGVGKILLILCGLIFFIPGFCLLADGIRTRNRKRLRTLRILSGGSLFLTLAALVANFLSVRATQTVGDAVYGILRVVSTPMMCVQYWVISLFLWACLFAGTLAKKEFYRR